ncbi:hypothetical protein ACFX13_011200 [Malus domestica]
MNAVSSMICCKTSGFEHRNDERLLPPVPNSGCTRATCRKEDEPYFANGPNPSLHGKQMKLFPISMGFSSLFKSRSIHQSSTVERIEIVGTARGITNFFVL